MYLSCCVRKYTNNYQQLERICRPDKVRSKDGSLLNWGIAADCVKANVAVFNTVIKNIN